MDAGGAQYLRGGPIDQSIGDSEDPWPFRCPYCPRQFYSLQAFGHHKSSHRRERSLAPATTAAAPLTRPLLPEIHFPDVVMSLRPPVPKIPKEKTKVSGEPKQKRRCLCGMYLPVGSDNFSDHETSEEKDDVEDDDAGRGGNGYDGDDDSDTGSTANLSNLDLELKI